MKKSFKQYLSEIYPGVAQDEKVFAFYINHIKNEKLLGKAENNCSVYFGELESKYVYILRKDDEQKSFLGYLAGGFIKIDGTKFWQTNYAYFDSSVRGKGYATSLFSFILKKLHTPIISDETQSPDGRKLWSSLRKTFNCKIYDSENNKFLSLNSIPETELYTSDETDNKHNRYYLVLEKSSGLESLGPNEYQGPSYVLYEQTKYTATEFLGTYY